MTRPFQYYLVFRTNVFSRPYRATIFPTRGLIVGRRHRPFLRQRFIMNLEHFPLPCRTPNRHQRFRLNRFIWRIVARAIIPSIDNDDPSRTNFRTLGRVPSIIHPNKVVRTPNSPSNSTTSYQWDIYRKHCDTKRHGEPFPTIPNHVFSRIPTTPRLRSGPIPSKILPST